MPYAVFTRALDAGSAYASALAPLGLEVIAMPVTRTEPPPDPGALARALEAGGHAAIVIASPRAAAALASARGRAPLPEIWAVGPATQRALAAAGIAAIHPEGVLDGAALARAMVAGRDLAGRRVLLPRAADGRDELAAILRAAGAEIDDVVAYRTVPASADDPPIARGRALLVTGAAAVCVVFAPSQVAALGALVGPLGAICSRFVAIGDTTGDALRAAGVPAVEVAATPTPEGVANAVAAVYPPR